MKKKKILLTGAGGFIGSNIIGKLYQDYEFSILDDFTNQKKFDFISRKMYSNIYQIDDLNIALKNNYDIIIHMGAITDTTEDDFEKLNTYNVQYSKNLWNYSVKNKIPFIYASSAATYGDGAMGFDDSHISINNLKPLNKYGLSKHVFDLWALSQKDCPPFWYGMKFFNVYGLNENNKANMASVVHWGIPFIKKNKYINLFKSNDELVIHGEQKRDFLFCEDIINVVLFLIDKKPISGIYNIGSGEARSFNDLARIIFDNLNIKPDIRYIDMPKNLLGKYQNFTKANILKIKKAGFSQFSNLEIGINKIINNQK